MSRPSANAFATFGLVNEVQRLRFGGGGA